MLTTLEKAVAWAQTKSMWPDTFGLACCAIEMMSIVSSRYDIARFGMEAFRSSPRQADLLIVSGRVVAQDGRAAPPDLRPDARAEVGDRDGRVRELRRDVQQLHDPPGRRQDRRRRHPRARLPAAARGADGGDRPAAREGARPASRPRTRSAGSPSDATKAFPGVVRDEGAVRRDDARRRPAAAGRGLHCTCATSEGFNFLADIAAADYLGWGEPRTSPATSATASGRDLNAPGSLGPRSALPEPKPKRFSVSYHLLRVARRRRRACASRSGSTTARAVAERRRRLADRRLARARGLRPDGHRLRGPPEPRADPDGRRLGGHPLRKDYPIGGEPVRFSGEE